ncbi:MAG: amidohydrolase family protein [Acidobacteria bacterium]|nr:amidohydrolase family protein [Acidobacteriota bacterium]
MRFTRRHFLGVMAAAPTASSQPARGKIDIHVHLGRDRQDMERVNSSNVAEHVKYLVARMDSAGIEKSLIVPVEPLFPTKVYLEAAKLAPERLIPACSVVPRPANTAVELLKEHHKAGAKALKLQPMQYDPRDPMAERMIYEAVKLRIPVLFHFTDTPLSFPGMLEHVASTFSDGQFVVIHFGGVYGFERVLPLARLPNVWLETSTAFTQVVNSPAREKLHFLKTEKRLNKLVFGSEAPMHYNEVFRAIDGLIDGSGAADAIYRRNAERILRLTISARSAENDQGRSTWQKVPEILRAMGIQAGNTVADIGAGDGYFIGSLSRAVGPKGKVYAVDVNESTLKRLRTRIQEDELANVQVIEGAAGDPKLAPASVDAALVCDSYHEWKEYPAMLAKTLHAVKPGGRLVIVDMIGRGEERRKQPRSKLIGDHEIAPAMVESEMKEAGFEIGERRDPFTTDGDKDRFLVVGRRSR